MLTDLCFDSKETYKINAPSGGGPFRLPLRFWSLVNGTEGEHVRRFTVGAERIDLTVEQVIAQSAAKLGKPSAWILVPADDE